MLLEISNLKIHFRAPGGPIRAVDGVTLDVGEEEIVGLVGESGSGKSVTALSILRLLPEPPAEIVSGRILFEGVELLTLSEKEMRAIRGDRISMIFQEPVAALNPVLTIGDQIAEGIELHRQVSRGEAIREAVEWLSRVEIPSAERRVKDYPHQLSGGMCQRVMIAMALATRPRLLIADEPTTALDVTIQAQILDLLLRLKEEMKMSILLITHNLGIVAEMAHRVAVMQSGRIVECQPTRALFDSPRHPYTVELLRLIPGRAEVGG
jgi:ABC-type dipeptide/oligopeptide/nickel transport system ATPase component